MLVDILGLLLAVYVSLADLHDGKGAGARSPDSLYCSHVSNRSGRIRATPGKSCPKGVLHRATGTWKPLSIPPLHEASAFSSASGVLYLLFVSRGLHFIFSPT